MSVGKTANKETVSVFTKDGINVFKEEDIFITCKGKLILIRVRDGHERYQIPLMQQPGTVATAASIQTNKESTLTNQQRLGSPVNQTSHQMDACRMWLPSKIDLDQGHQSGQLRGLADAG